MTAGATVKFDGKNYRQWAMYMEALFMHKAYLEEHGESLPPDFSDQAVGCDVLKEFLSLQVNAEDFWKVVMINNLPSEYGGAITSLGSLEHIPIRDIGARIRERLWGLKKVASDFGTDEAVKSETALVVKQETRTCYNCGKVGHLAKKCRKPKNTDPAKKGTNEIGKAKTTEYAMNVTSRQGHTKKTEHALNLVEHRPAPTQETTVPDSRWYVDSAASYHYCNTKSVMYDLEPVDLQVQVATET
ncbi:hypothetical protein V1508DRAFT_443054 [Lipomyces doorenjongii]|uniref:uncharacterized protein n=1 Tax=Lipomyces doorenjongii TaxID=383834 RepID=UPI0034CF8316